MERIQELAVILFKEEAHSNGTDLIRSDFKPQELERVQRCSIEAGEEVIEDVKHLVRLEYLEFSDLTEEAQHNFEEQALYELRSIQDIEETNRSLNHWVMYGR